MISDKYAMANSADPFQTVLEEQSDHGLHCLHSICTFWTIFSIEKPLSLNFKVITANILGVLKFRTFTILTFIVCFKMFIKELCNPPLSGWRILLTLKYIS